MTTLAARAREGDRRAVARLLSVVETGGPEANAVIAALYPHTGQAYTIGITGAPGSGKSTLTDRLVTHIRNRGDEVGVLAVDPSSPFSGGAILGDRVRMQDHASDDGVFIRSMASRGHLGGLARATPQAIRVLDAAGMPWVLIETVGVGQVEVEIAERADTTVVVVNPRWGDAVQAAKAGLLEIADCFVVNKADRPGAEETRRDLEAMLELAGEVDWRPPIIETVATEGGGVEELWEAILTHRRFLESDGSLATRRARRAREEVGALVEEHAPSGDGCEVRARWGSTEADSLGIVAAQLVSTEISDDGVALVTLDRPKLNALSVELLAQLGEAAVSLQVPEVKAVVLTGAGRSFAAGADIDEFGDRAQARIITDRFRRTCDELAGIRRPVIAAINGFALGGGLELALACDLRVAADDVRLGQPEILLGIIPGGGGTQRLARLVGPARAKEIVWSGRQLAAPEAVAIGLVDRVVGSRELVETAREWARELALGAVVAMGIAKRVIDDGLDLTLAEGLALESDAFVETFTTEDAGIGIASFREHGPGKARFRGR